MKFEIKNRWTGELIIAVEAENWRFAVEAAIKSKANLSKANLSKANLSEADLSWANLSEANLSEANLSKADLSWADLSWANLSWANLSKANLSKANLSEANLSEADLSEADLSWADLSEANLSEANLSKADLSWADLSWANLSWANLSKANLSEANLSEANLSEANPRSLRHIKHDIWGVLLHAIPEIPYLRQALIDGKVDGSIYEGECACLCGTIANARHCKVADLAGIQADADSMAERFFMAIKPGDTPKTNSASELAVEWIDELTELLPKQV